MHDPCVLVLEERGSEVIVEVVLIELVTGSSASASYNRPLFPTPTKLHHKSGRIAAATGGGSRPSGPSVTGVKRHRPAILGHKGPSATVQRAPPKRMTPDPTTSTATTTPDPDTALLSTAAGDFDPLLGTDLTGLGEKAN